MVSFQVISLNLLHFQFFKKEEKNEKKKAADYFALAAELSANDSELWEKISNLYKDSEYYE